MITVKTETSRVKLANGDLANGHVIVAPTAAFVYSPSGADVKVTRNTVKADIVDGELSEPLSLAPCQGDAHAPTGVLYTVLFTFGSVTERQYWLLHEDDDGTEIEITDVTLASVAGLPAYVELDDADLAAITAHMANVSNPHSVTKTQVGLGNADNTSDANKPVSTAQAAADAVVASDAAAALAAHAAAADPHAGYQKESEKGQANGYAGLDVNGTVPDAQIPATIARDSEVSAAVAAAVAALVDSSPATLDTLNELAAAIGDDPNFVTTFSNLVAAAQADADAAQADATQALADAADAQSTADAANTLANNVNLREEILVVAATDENTVITAGTAKVTFRAPCLMVLSQVPRATLNVAQTGGSLFTVDINEDGASILSTKITIDNNEKTSRTAATPGVLSDSSIADDAEVAIDVDGVGTGSPTGLKIAFYYRRFA